MTPIPQSPASKPYNPTIPQTLSRVVLGIGGWSSRGTGAMHAGDRCNPILLAGSTGGGGLGGWSYGTKVAGDRIAILWCWGIYLMERERERERGRERERERERERD